MWWLWIAGPVAAALVFLLTDWRDPRREGELARWRARHTAKDPSLAKSVTSLPGPLMRVLLAAGGGRRRDWVELVPKLAYLAVMGGDAFSGSDHQTVVAKLDESAPTFTVRPLPILDGQREANTGVQFKKDPEFMEAFIVERFLEGSDTEGPAANEATDKAIRKWLSPPVRAALLEMPDLWLRVEGKSMGITLYGPVDADRLNDLVIAADVIFAEYGAEGGPSLFGDDEHEDAAPKPAAKAAPAAKKAGGTKKPSASKSA